MSTEQNKAIVRRIYTDVNDGQRYDVLDEICRPDVIVHDPIAGEQRGIEAYRGLFAFFRQAFGEQRTDLHRFVAEGERHIDLAAHRQPLSALLDLFVAGELALCVDFPVGPFAVRSRADVQL
jgi:hypothetical protein